MAAKLREKHGFYWVVVHHRGQRKWKKIGKDKREAQKVVHKVNAQLAVGEFSMDRGRKVPTVEDSLRRWYDDYKPTFLPPFAEVANLNIECHLIPWFGSLRLSELEERHILRFVRAKVEGDGNAEPLRASTVLNILSVLRRVLALAIEEGHIERSPCRNLGSLLSKVKRRQSAEVETVNAWSREEVATLLEVAQEEEPRLWRHQTAPPRHQAASCRKYEKAPPRNSAERL